MEHKFSLIVGKNGTVEVEREVETNWWREILMGLTVLTSSSLNLILVVGLTGEKRRTYFNGLLVALSLASTIDSILNQTSSLLFLLVVPQSVCWFSATTSTLSLILEVYYISFIAISVLPRKLMPLLPPAYYTVSPIVISIALVLPLIFASRSIVVRHYSNRDTCGTTGDSLFYSVALISLGFGLPSSAMCYYIIVTKSSTCFYLLFQQDSTDIKQTKYVSLLLITFTIFLLPFIISLSISSVTPIHRHSTYQENNSTVIITGLYDNIFAWARLQFNLISPILALSIFKNIRKTILHVLCFSSNEVQDENSPEKTFILATKQSKRTESYGQSTPVIFGTSEGLMLRTLDLTTDTFRYKIDICDHVDTERVFSSAGASEQIDEANMENRKVVRFARSIKEISSFEGEWNEISPEIGNQKD